jgi:prepilin peptidase CpaA
MVLVGLNLGLMLPVFLGSMVLVTAAAYDVLSRRVPNWLSLVGFVLGVTLHGLLYGWAGAGSALIAGLVVLIGMFAFFAVGWLGAGDVKLMAAAAAIGGSLGVAAKIVLFTVILGAAMGLLLTLLGGHGRRLGRKLKELLALAVITKRLPSYEAEADMGITTLPYAVPIAIGSLLALAWEAGMMG